MKAATYYDHAKNMSNASVGQAVAAAKRDAVACGDAFRVEANWPGKERFFWVGCQYDAERLAAELRFNRAENVTVSRV